MRNFWDRIRKKKKEEKSNINDLTVSDLKNIEKEARKEIEDFFKVFALKHPEILRVNIHSPSSLGSFLSFRMDEADKIHVTVKFSLGILSGN